MLSFKVDFIVSCKTISIFECKSDGIVTDFLKEYEIDTSRVKLNIQKNKLELDKKIEIDKEVIAKYGLCSKEGAMEIAKKICMLGESNLGISAIKDELENLLYLVLYNADNDTWDIHTIQLSQNKKKDFQEVQRILEKDLSMTIYEMI